MHACMTCASVNACRSLRADAMDPASSGPEAIVDGRCDEEPTPLGRRNDFIRQWQGVAHSSRACERRWRGVECQHRWTSCAIASRWASLLRQSQTAACQMMNA